MKLERKYTHKGVTWDLLTQPDPDVEDVSVPVQGTLSVSAIEDMEFPLTIRVISNNCKYIELEDWKKSIESPTDLPVKFGFLLSYSEERQHITIQINDNIGSEIRPRCNVRSSHVANLSSHVLVNTDIEKVRSDIHDYYSASKPLAYSSFRKDARKHVGYEGYYQILNYLYKHDQKEHDELAEQIMRSMKKHVVSEKGEYFAKSMASLEDMLEYYDELDYLPSLVNEYRHELRGYLQEVLAKEAAAGGNFQTANEHISKSIKHFEQADRTEINTPAILKQYAIKALINESDGDFEEAANLYEDAADEADEDDSRVYEIWSILSLAKQDFADGNYEQGKQRVENIPEDYDDVNLVDLRKLTILIDLFDDYKQGVRSEAKRVFKRDELPHLPGVVVEEGTYRDITAQLEIDYSSAYSMLLNRQRISQLGQDPGINKSFKTAIVDGITPGGMDTDEKRDSTADGGTAPEKRAMSSIAKDTATHSRPIVETERKQRDPRFTQNVYEAYDNTCAICGSQRETPDGRPEVEAAHIQPVADDGSDEIVNGIALCRLHHWAFDEGWISISEDYTILVKNAPDANGYDDFIQFQDERMVLPDDENHWPAEEYLAHHRQTQEFN
jgi:tetratricopeptide (TPR) repeat protein